MTKRDKLKQILQVLDPSKGTKVDFAELDTQINKLKDALKEKIQAQTLDDVNNQLDRFQKKLDFTPLQEAMANLESALDQKIQGISGLLSNETSALRKSLASSESGAKDQISTIASNIDALKSELLALENQKNVELVEIRNNITDLTSFNAKVNKNLKSIRDDLESFKAEDEKADKEEIAKLEASLEKVRLDMIARFGRVGGGAMNRQNYINNVDPLLRYTDINWKAGSNVTITYANNDTTKRVDITIASSGGGGGGTVRSINSISTSQTAGSTSGTDYVYLCSGTLTLTLPDATTNTNLYTVKNVGTGIVTIDTTASQTIDGNLTITMATQFTSVDLISDTANWNIT